MHQKNFIIFNGNNGATYIINTKNWSSLALSLQFYKARSLKQKLLKFMLHFVLFNLAKVNRLVNINFFKSIEDVSQYIHSLGCNADLLIDDNSSILISPTGDKVIVNHHNQYFHKFAFYESYENVRREADIYKLIGSRAEHFSISHAFDFLDDAGTACSFKMQPPAYVKKAEPSASELVLPLLNFFNFSKNGKKVNILPIASALSDDVILIFPNSSSVISQLFKKLKFNEEMELELGLVHGDFKPWNILFGSPIVFFDFEEAVSDGLPLEDLFNFIIDPEVRYKSVESLTLDIFNDENVHAYRDYLTKLGCEVSFVILLYLYLLGRIKFWAEQNQVETASSYFNLLLYIDKSENNLHGE